MPNEPTEHHPHVVRSQWGFPAGTLSLVLETDDPVSPDALRKFGEIVAAIEESGLVPVSPS